MRQQQEDIAAPTSTTSPVVAQGGPACGVNAAIALKPSRQRRCRAPALGRPCCAAPRRRYGVKMRTSQPHETLAHRTLGEKLIVLVNFLDSILRRGLSPWANICPCGPDHELCMLGLPKSACSNASRSTSCNFTRHHREDNTTKSHSCGSAWLLKF